VKPNPCFTLALISAMLLPLGLARGHGGTYRAPADSVPPGGGDSSSGAAATGSTGTQAGSSGGSTQAGSGSGTSSGSSSSNPATPGPGLPAGPGGALWESWWAFNRDPFLNLKSVVHGGGASLGSDEFFLGHVPLDAARDHRRPDDEVIHGRVVPALLKVPETETAHDLVTGALIALAKIGADPAKADAKGIAARIRPFLASANQEIAETAAVSLGILADPAAIGTLEALLGDTEAGRQLVAGHEVSWRTRAFAAYGLGLIGYRAGNVDVRRHVVHYLTEVLGGPALGMATPDVAVACVIALGLVPLPVDPGCGRGMDDRPVAMHCRRCQVEWLLELSRRAELREPVRAHTPTTLARLVAGRGVDHELKRRVAGELLRLARGGDKILRDLRCGAIGALGLLGDADEDEVDRAIFAGLVAVAGGSRDLDSRTLALVSLGQVAGRRGSAKGPKSETLGGARRFVLAALKEGRSSDQAWAALALGQLERSATDAGFDPSPEVAGALRAALRGSGAPTEAGALALALGIMRDGESSDEVLKKVEAISDDAGRGYLCVALGLMDARRAEEPLRELLHTSRYRPLLLRQVAIALGLIGDRDLVPDLVDQLRNATGLTAQSSIAAALGEIGDARSVEPLLAMLEDEEINVRGRAFAVVALGIVADKEPLPWNSKLAIGVNYRAATATLSDGQGGGVLDIL